MNKKQNGQYMTPRNIVQLLLKKSTKIKFS